jgi:hypothetical protein
VISELPKGESHHQKDHPYERRLKKGGCPAGAEGANLRLGSYIRRREKGKLRDGRAPLLPSKQGMHLCLVEVSLALHRIGAQVRAELFELYLVGRALQDCLAQVLE